MDAEGGTSPLRLYYVSPKMAALRQQAVKPGWYVVAVPGTSFELAITAVQPGFPTINGSKLPESHAAEAILYIDCEYEFQVRSEIADEEFFLKGFVESVEFADGEIDGKETCRRLVFQKSSVLEDEDGATGNMERREQSSIRLVVVSGKSIPAAEVAQSETVDVGVKNTTVSEKSAAKEGKSLFVQSGEVVKNARCDISEDLETETEAGFVEVFLREKYWMMARRIIDEDGNPWTPKSEIKTEDTHLAVHVKGEPSATSRFEMLLT